MSALLSQRTNRESRYRFRSRRPRCRPVLEGLEGRVLLATVTRQCGPGRAGGQHAASGRERGLVRLELEYAARPSRWSRPPGLTMFRFPGRLELGRFSLQCAPDL